MKTKIIINEREIKKLIADHLNRVLNGDFKDSNLKIMVKSKQNYKSEWEVADFEATYIGEI